MIKRKKNDLRKYLSLIGPNCTKMWLLVNIYGFCLDWIRITENVQFNTVFCRSMKPKIQYVNINTVVSVPRVVQSIIDFWQVLFICVNNTPGSVWKHFPYPSKYPKTIKISLKTFEKICWPNLKWGLIKSFIEILQSMKDIEFHHFIKDSRMSELSKISSILKLVWWKNERAG